jgi:hypothetical protein
VEVIAALVSNYALATNTNAANESRRLRLACLPICLRG